MCRNCEPILGRNVKKHDEKECPLMQASYCSICCTKGHFTKRCPNKPASSLSDNDKEVPNEKEPLPTKPTCILSEHPAAHVEYLKLYDQEPFTAEKRNVAAVKKHLEARGFEVTEHIRKALTAKCDCSKCVKQSLSLRPAL
jgi:hypothetical protein